MLWLRTNRPGGFALSLPRVPSLLPPRIYVWSESLRPTSSQTLINDELTAGYWLFSCFMLTCRQLFFSFLSKRRQSCVPTLFLHWKHSHKLQSLWVLSQFGQWESCSVAGGPVSHELSVWGGTKRSQVFPGHHETPSISLEAALGNPGEEGSGRCS